MSIRLTPVAENAPNDAYVVTAPRKGDMLCASLRSAYHMPERGIDPFGDLMQALEHVEYRPKQ